MKHIKSFIENKVADYIKKKREDRKLKKAEEEREYQDLLSGSFEDVMAHMAREGWSEDIIEEYRRQFREGGVANNQ